MTKRKKAATTADKAKKLIKRLEDGEELKGIKKTFDNEQEWFTVSSKVYKIKLNEAQNENKKNEVKEHVSVTANSTIIDIFNLNEKLSDYALGVPVSATEIELRSIQNLVTDLPNTEQEIIDIIERFNMHPKWRTMQKLGRIRQYDAFKSFDKIIDAALLNYYRENYISCFLTLTPVIEGVLLRWMNYTGVGKKPEFEQYRKFFKKGQTRQPAPYNIQFHKIFSDVCDKIINKTLYKSTQSGDAYKGFNRHVPLHLLKESNFGTKNNCIRLFILLDLMTEIYLYEGKFHDPRWDLKPVDMEDDIDIYGNLLVDQKLLDSAEKKIFNLPR